MEETDTLRQALEKMEHHGYAAVPLLSTEGKYLGTLTDGDVLWGLKKLNFPSLYQMEEIPVMQVNRSRDNKPVHVNVDMEGLLEKVSAQNFVPVIDDEKVFIGIITRRDVIHYLANSAAVGNKCYKNSAFIYQTEGAVFVFENSLPTACEFDILKCNQIEKWRVWRRRSKRFSFSKMRRLTTGIRVRKECPK